MQIRVKRENQRIIRRDACEPSSACNVRRRPVQVATQARSRESVSPPSAQHRLEADAASPARHILGDASLPDVDAELEQLAVDAWRTPQRIGDTHLPD